MYILFSIDYLEWWYTVALSNILLHHTTGICRSSSLLVGTWGWCQPQKQGQFITVYCARNIKTIIFVLSNNGSEPFT